MIDYRGDETIINSRGDCLFDYRTKYFLRIQEDFHYWKQWGHKFRCFTQHHQSKDFKHFDDVVYIPRGNAAASRNQVLDYYKRNSWIAIWDNDATLYWDKLDSKLFPSELDAVCDLADKENIISFIPFNSQQSPYPKQIKDRWTFKPQIAQKGTMMFIKNIDCYFDETMTALSDLERACRLVLLGYKTAICEQISLNELDNGKSTIFKVNAYHEQYKKPGPKANPKGLLKWDAQLDRNEKYKKNILYIENKLGSIENIKNQHKILWNPLQTTFSSFFEYAPD